ncbi:UNVERIFIED_CONTAM: hypothetical protein GTU68_022333 [Idotea baltica]|nr:hypothetical protein [Idotea baltica]
MLGQIERNESSPTIATLWKIAKGFHKPLSLFVDEAVIADDDGIVRKHPNSVTSQEHDLKANILFPFDPRFGFEVFSICLESQQTHVSEAHDKGVFEHIMVIEGELEININDKWKILAKGDVLRFAADQQHTYRNKSNKERVVFHDIIYYQ